MLEKKNAAIKFCEDNGLIYKLVDVGILSNDEIKKLREDGLIVFIDRYEIKYQNLFGGKE